MERETKSVVKIGLNNDNQMIVEFDYDMFQSEEDIEPLYLILGVLRKTERQLLDVLESLEHGEEGMSDIDELLGGGL